MIFLPIKKRKSLKSDDLQALGLDPDRMPVHVAVIMDGNGRWAKKRLLNRVKGHEKGSESVRILVKACRELKIPFLTLYAFSTENWARPQSEVAALMQLLKKFLAAERDEMKKNGICLKVLGQLQKLPEEVQREANATMAATCGNAQMTLNLALSYGSRQEITQAVKILAKKVETGELSADQIGDQVISDHLYTAGIPDPDLVIRTSGEFRLSNFLLWQSAYAELFITPTLWPDFTRSEFIDILTHYQKRDRRFGNVECSMPSDGSPQ
jgi:undecaprenyl diphosphate synthase